MLTPGLIYVAILTVVLLVALGACLSVLRKILRQGLERRRKWKAGERERYTEDEEYGPPAFEEDAGGQICLTCRHCGAENDPTFGYCRRCAEQL